MRLLNLAAGASLALAACGNNDQSDKTTNVDENLTAENIVSNDVTAIDAVTGDAANMAADVDMNFGNLEENAGEAATNAPGKSARPAPKKPEPAPKAAPEANTTANAAGNSE
jgi:hypothetical protein